MDICTLIAAVSCRQSIHFIKPTMMWSCGRIVVNDLMVVDQVDDKEFFEEVLDLFCVEDFDGEELWTEQGELLQCQPRPVFVPAPRWTEPKHDLASMATAFVCAPLHALRAAFGVVRSWLSPTCWAVAATCGEVPVGARPMSSRRASMTLHSIMLDGYLVSRDEIDEECEWLGVDGRFAAEADQWYDDYTGVGQSSCETDGMRRPMDTTHTDRSGRVTHVRHCLDMVMVEGPLLPGWERGEDNSVTKTETYKVVASSKRWEKQRSSDRRLARRIKQEVLGC